MNYYIHIPFCRSKCGYCAFYSESGCDSERMNLFLEHLAVKLSVCRDTAETVYVGGGTPTLLSCCQLEKLIAAIKSCLPLTENCEISIEANPETLDEKKVALLRNFFTRISVGVQSFDPDLRARIGRKCSQTALENALRLVREADFPHWNCDLIYALPGQGRPEWERELHRAAESGADHISCYSLTPEEGAALGWSFGVDDIRERELYEAAEKELAKYGIYRYEISNYAVPCGECKHNCNVWRGGVLRGFGPSAAGFDGIDRTTEPADLDKWLADAAPEVDSVPPELRLNEIFAVTLRTVAGWNSAMWSGVPHADQWVKRLEIAGNLKKSFPGCLSINDNEIKLSPRGLLFWNEIAEYLF